VDEARLALDGLPLAGPACRRTPFFLMAITIGGVCMMSPRLAISCSSSSRVSRRRPFARHRPSTSWLSVRPEVQDALVALCCP